MPIVKPAYQDSFSLEDKEAIMIILLQTKIIDSDEKRDLFKENFIIDIRTHVRITEIDNSTMPTRSFFSSGINSTRLILWFHDIKIKPHARDRNGFGLG